MMIIIVMIIIILIIIITFIIVIIIMAINKQINKRIFFIFFFPVLKYIEYGNFYYISSFHKLSFLNKDWSLFYFLYIPIYFYLYSWVEFNFSNVGGGTEVFSLFLMGWNYVFQTGNLTIFSHFYFFMFSCPYPSFLDIDDFTIYFPLPLRAQLFLFFFLIATVLLAFYFPPLPGFSSLS